MASIGIKTYLELSRRGNWRPVCSSFIITDQFQCTMLPTQQLAALPASPQTDQPLFQPPCSHHKPLRIHYTETQCSNCMKTQNVRSFSWNRSHCWAQPTCVRAMLCWAQENIRKGSSYHSIPASPLKSAFCSSALWVPAAAVTAGFYQRLLTKTEVKQVCRDRGF